MTTAMLNIKYYPYGGTFAEGLAVTPQPYKFGGKELDRMNGLDWSDFGARMLDSASPSWGTIDPMAEKYYSISPYTYCAANPILYVDPNGMVIMIGNVHYEVGMTYHGKNEFTRNLITALNVISKYGGEKLVADLIKSGTKYNYKENNTEQSSYTTQQHNGDVNININTNSTGGYKDAFYAAVAHETMHGAQYENGQGGAAIFNEVEANAFQQYISFNSLGEKDSFQTMITIETNTPSQTLYTNAISQLSNAYSSEYMKIAVHNFKKGSMNNNSGVYSKNPLIPNTQNGKLRSMLKLYYK